MLTKLQYYYLRFKAKYDAKLNIVWAKHIQQENILGWSKEYSKSAQIKHIFNIFYSIKSKMELDHTYRWEQVIADYSMPIIYKNMQGVGMNIKDIAEVFEINTSLQGYTDNVTYDGAIDVNDIEVKEENGEDTSEDTYEVFTFREGANDYPILYTEFGDTTDNPITVITYTVSWVIPLCVINILAYLISWSNPICATNTIIYETEWSNSICVIDTITYSSSWDTQLCVIDNVSHTTTWSDSICVSEYYEPKVGDSFQGGVVFYLLKEGDYGYDPLYIKGLISSQYETVEQWSTNINDSVSGTELGIGYGNQNTEILCESNNHTAAISAKSLVLNGYNDWYLPSYVELGKLIAVRNIIGGLQQCSEDSVYPQYWSSSNSSQSIAYSCYFTINTNTSQYFTDFMYKIYLHIVHPIRSFSVLI